MSVYLSCAAKTRGRGSPGRKVCKGPNGWFWSHHPLDINQLPCPGGGYSSFKPGTDCCLSVNLSSRQEIVLFSTLFLAPRYLVHALHTVGPQ